MKTVVPNLKQLATPNSTHGQAPQLGQPATQMQQGPSQKEVLLSQLQDVSTPAPVGYWPLAPGWWVLIALFFAVVIASITGFMAWQKNKKLNKYRKTAQRLLAKLESDFNTNTINAQEALQQLNVLTKQAYFAAYPAARLTISGESGERWYEWLNKTIGKSGNDLWAALDKSVFELSYQPTRLDGSNNHDSHQKVNHLFGFCRRWIKAHPRLTNQAWRALTSQRSHAITEQQVAPSAEAQHV